MGMASTKKEESEEERMKRIATEALKKLAPEVHALEQKLEKLKRDFDRATDEGTAGKHRAAFLAEAKLINEIGTLLLIKFDGVELHPKDNVNRQVRKGQIQRVQAIDKSLATTGLLPSVNL